MKDWTGQKILIVGAARQGIALARYLAAHGAQVILNDRLPVDQWSMKPVVHPDELTIRLHGGGHPLDLLEGVDLCCISGGVSLNLPLVVEAQRKGIKISNDSQIFLELAPCKVVGITGSAGKTTTTTLVGRIAEAAKAMGFGPGQSGPYFFPQRVWVGGNIGSPLIAEVDDIYPDDLAVMELSSFQLEIMTRSPQVAAVLNVTPNHLDRHVTMEAYKAAKARILDFQGAQDMAVLGLEDPGAYSLTRFVHGKLFTFGFGEPEPGYAGGFLQSDAIVLRKAGGIDDRLVDTPVMTRPQIELRGEHNILNVIAACTIAAAAGLPVESMPAGAQGFTGVAHRLEFIRTWKGANWYNDSIATAPERTIAAIRSFKEPLVLLLGGRDKNLPWEDLAEWVYRRVEHVIVFGEAREKIIRALEAPPQSSGQWGLAKDQGDSAQRPFTIRQCSGLKEAVQAAAEVVQAGDVVLLSPGGTSFDEFKDFEERGRCFVQWVKELS